MIYGINLARYSVKNRLKTQIEKGKSMQKSTPNKTYLGDAVYADFNGHQVILTTEDGIQKTNKIFLEYEVIVALKKYFLRLEDAIKKQS